MCYSNANRVLLKMTDSFSICCCQMISFSFILFSYSCFLLLTQLKVAPNFKRILHKSSNQHHRKSLCHCDGTGSWYKMYSMKSQWFFNPKLVPSSSLRPDWHLYKLTRKSTMVCLRCHIQENNLKYNASNQSYCEIVCMKSMKMHTNENRYPASWVITCWLGSNV